MNASNSKYPKEYFKKGVSIIICCYNSANRITPTLKHIAAQKVPESFDWEVILVNNNCTDDTVEVAERVWEMESCKVPFYIVDEPIPGLSNARMRGVRCAKYEYILFCDDDNWLAEDYLKLSFETMEGNPSIGVLGGRGEGVSNIPFPFWFSCFQGDYAVGVQQIESGYVVPPKALWGAGMVIRHSLFLVLKKCGFRNILIGRDGSKASSGEDVEICKWFNLGGYQLYYNEKMVYKHYIEPSRLKISYLKALQNRFREARKVIVKYDYFIQRGSLSRKKLFFKWFASMLKFLARIKSKEKRSKYLAEISAFSPIPFFCFDPDIRKIAKSLERLKRLRK